MSFPSEEKDSPKYSRVDFTQLEDTENPFFAGITLRNREKYPTSHTSDEATLHALHSSESGASDESSNQIYSKITTRKPLEDSKPVSEAICHDLTYVGDAWERYSTKSGYSPNSCKPSGSNISSISDSVPIINSQPLSDVLTPLEYTHLGFQYKHSNSDSLAAIPEAYKLGDCSSTENTIYSSVPGKRDAEALNSMLIDANQIQGGINPSISSGAVLESVKPVMVDKMVQTNLLSLPTDSSLRETKSEEQKRYKCSVCEKMFNRPSSLKTHIYSHTGEKPYVCQVIGCQKKFSVLSNLRRHLKTHQHNSWLNRSASPKPDLNSFPSSPPSTSSPSMYSSTLPTDIIQELNEECNSIDSFENQNPRYSSQD